MGVSVSGGALVGLSEIYIYIYAHTSEFRGLAEIYVYIYIYISADPLYSRGWPI
jgi:hypothetical protein